ncbi:protein of unknown function [Methylocaldum szegediense]|uniref:Uncharacterized protein n=1 Tax=Methylocaldum szegediense TaxID=73780 RepID=A0ABN8X8M9_9GAMM|nr:protein of unknown function [Methylocaldum szegediense]
MPRRCWTVTYRASWRCKCGPTSVKSLISVVAKKKAVNGLILNPLTLSSGHARLRAQRRTVYAHALRA